MKKYIDKVKYLGFLGILRLIRDLLISALFFKIGTLVRYPFYLRSLGTLEIGTGFRSGPGLVIDILNDKAKIKIGKNFRANSRLHLGCADNIIIGDNVLIASDVYISDHTHGSYNYEVQNRPETLVNHRELVCKKIKISNNVWIGEKTCVLPGVTIGENSIVGALSLVNKNIPPNSIYSGIPARCIKVFDSNSNKWIAP
jgi:lipopolysaccharide O-acetyltransferase